MRKAVRRTRRWWNRTPNDHVAVVFTGTGSAFVLVALLGWAAFGH